MNLIPSEMRTARNKAVFPQCETAITLSNPGQPFTDKGLFPVKPELFPFIGNNVRGSFFYMLMLILLPAALLLSSAGELTAQQIQVQEIEATAGHSPEMYSLDAARVRVEGEALVIESEQESFQIDLIRQLSFSRERNFVAAMNLEMGLQHLLIDGLGRRVGTIELDHFDPDDQTLGLSVFSDGRFVTRDNVANFNFYNPEGTLRYSISNSSGSPDGEVASRILSDPSGNVILLYNPRITYGEDEGSRARILEGEGAWIELYQSLDRSIKYAGMTGNGSFIVLVSQKEGTDDEVAVFDRFGNELITFTSEEDLKGASLTEEGRIVTIFSAGRIQVYRITDQERLGSTSIRAGEILHAAYHEEDQQILALSGNLSNDHRISSPYLHAIHLAERSLDSTELEGILTFPDLSHIQFDRVGPNRFRLMGMNRGFEIETRF